MGDGHSKAIVTGGYAQADRQALNHSEQMLDANRGCVRCKLCGGSAVISDAGPGAGYYIRCGNWRSFRTHAGCIIGDQRIGGWAYNAQEWWNRLHGGSASTVDSPFEAMIFDAHLPSMTARFRIPPGLPFAGGMYELMRVRSVTPADEARWAHLPEPPDLEEDES